MEDNKDLSTIQENSESKENSIQITETLTAEDLKKVNILLLSTKRNIITLIVGIIAIVYGAINLLVNKDKSSMAYDIILITLGVLGILFYVFFAKKLVIKKIESTEFKDLEPLVISLNEQGIIYRFISEPKDTLPYEWDLIKKAEGKHYYESLTACSTKILRMLYSMCKNNKRFLEE